MRLGLRKTRQFEKDLKRMAKRGMPLRELETVIDRLLDQTPLPENIATILWSETMRASASATCAPIGF